MGSVYIAQFTSESTAADVRLVLGFIPALVRYVQDHQGTNPNERWWMNRDLFDLWQAGADDSILQTGSSGVSTLDTSSISSYAGGDTVTSSDVSAGLYRLSDGTEPAAGTIVGAGIAIPAGDQTNSGKNVVFAWRCANPLV
jgi:hypothetical protein